MTESITDDTLIEGDDVTPSDGKQTDEAVSIKDVLAEELGKDFKDDASALKAVKDTFSYVGKAGKFKPVFEKLEAKFGSEKGALDALNQFMEQDNKPKDEPKIDTNQFVPREEFDRETFFSKNPEYAAHQALISDLKKATGKSFGEIVQSDTFKSIYDKAKAHDEYEQSKSVLQSNPRLGQVKDKISEAREASKRGDDNTARKSAVEAVIDAYELG